MEAKIEWKLTWHCCICCNPEKGRVDFEDGWLIKSSFITKDEMKACQLTKTKLPQKKRRKKKKKREREKEMILITIRVFSPTSSVTVIKVFVFCVFAFWQTYGVDRLRQFEVGLQVKKGEIVPR
jgi:hypothetical protein